MDFLKLRLVALVDHVLAFPFAEAGLVVDDFADAGHDLAFDPVRRPLTISKKLNQSYRAWCESRIAFNKAIGAMEPEAVRRGWQRDYMLGIDAEGDAVADHQTKVPLRPFRREA